MKLVRVAIKNMLLERIWKGTKMYQTMIFDLGSEIELEIEWEPYILYCVYIDIYLNRKQRSDKYTKNKGNGYIKR